MEKVSTNKKISTKSLVLCSLFAALICVGAFIEIPSPLVPFTMQWFFVASAGLLLGARLGFASVFSYIFIGLCGIPVFTKGGGIGYIFQTTFGYIIGFCIAAFVIGYISSKLKNNFKNFFISNIVGLVIVYAVGFVYLYFILKFHMGKDVGIFGLLKKAVIIFIPTDLMWAGLSAYVSSRVKKQIDI